MKFSRFPKVIVYDDGDLVWIPAPDCRLVDSINRIFRPRDDRADDIKVAPRLVIAYFDVSYNNLCLMLGKADDFLKDTKYAGLTWLHGVKIRKYIPKD